jgi:hypothetical protein
MKDMTLINMVLDRSGSMTSLQDEVVGSFNRFLKEQKELPDYAEFSLIQFDDQYEINYLRKPIKECEDLILGATYEPRGMTALLDAVGRTINHVGKDLDKLPEEEKPKKVLFVVITDGYENASQELTKDKVKEMIDHQKSKYGWDFIFLAAGIDAFAESGQMGIDASKAAGYGHDVQGVRGMFATVSSYSSSSRRSKSSADVGDLDEHKPQEETTA